MKLMFSLDMKDSFPRVGSAIACSNNGHYIVVLKKITSIVDYLDSL